MTSLRFSVWRIVRLLRPMYRSVRRFVTSAGAIFGSKFVLLAAASAFLDAFVVPTWSWLQAATAASVQHMVPLFGLSASPGFGSVLAFSGGTGAVFAYEIAPGCTAMMPIFLYTAAILSYPATWSNRGRGVLYGVLFLFGLNIVRLASMAWVGVQAPDLFEDAHLSWWQASFIIAVALTWWFWVQSLDPARSPFAIRARRILLQAGVFTGIFLSLWFVGSSAGARPFYQYTLWRSATNLAALFNVAIPASGANPGTFFLEHNGRLSFGWLALAVALFLSRPRIAWRPRLVATFWGIMASHAAAILGLLLRLHLQTRPAGIAPWVDPALLAFQVMAIGGVWFLQTPMLHGDQAAVEPDWAELFRLTETAAESGRTPRTAGSDETSV